MSKSTDLGLLVLRLGFGVTAATHGAQKLFGWFGGHGLEGTGGFFESVGFTPGKRNATLAGITETGGGLAVALGLATGPAGVALAGNMAVASSLHGFKKFYAQDGGPEMALAYAVVGSTLAFTGAGRYSLDALTGQVLDKPWMRGLAWASAAAAATSIVLARRKELASRPAPAEVSDEES